MNQGTRSCIFTRISTVLAAVVLVACGDGASTPGDHDATGGDAITSGDVHQGDGLDDMGDSSLPPATTGTSSTVEEPALPLMGGLPAATWPDSASREVVDLSGTWLIRFDPGDIGVEGAWYEGPLEEAEWTEIQVPGAWDMAREEWFDLQSVAWYALALDDPGFATRTILRFQGVFREAQVWLDGVPLGGTDLPYLPFAFDVTDLMMSGDHLLVVRIDNRITRETLPCDTALNPGKHGWFPYGGVLRPVVLEDSLDVSVGAVLMATTLDGGVEATVTFEGVGEGYRLSAAVLRGEVPVVTWDEVDVPEQGEALLLEGAVTAPDLWSPDHPEHVYTLRLTVAGPGSEDTRGYSFAFKLFEAKDALFFLNGEDTILKGVNRHEDHPTLGPIFDAAFVQGDLELVDQLGASFMRPGHYPNDVRTLQLIEASGVMLAEEIPVYQFDALHMVDLALVDKATRALQAMIVRDNLRPGIIMWSVANEIHNWDPASTAFIQTLYDTAKAIDPMQRPVMVAAVSMPGISEHDVSSSVVDVMGVNEYFGWYYGETTDVLEYLEAVRANVQGPTMFISEYGAGALLGTHLDGEPGEEPVDDHSYSEEYQAYFHTSHIAQFKSLSFIRGMMPWVLADFRMQWTPTTGKPHPVEKMNLKGLVDADRAKKPSFDVIKETYASW